MTRAQANPQAEETTQTTLGTVLPKENDTQVWIARLQQHNSELASDLSAARGIREQLESILAQRDSEIREQARREALLKQQRDAALGPVQEAGAQAADLQARVLQRERENLALAERLQGLEQALAQAQAAATQSQVQALEDRRQLEMQFAKLSTTHRATELDYQRLRDDVVPALTKARNYDQLLDRLPAWLARVVDRLAAR